MMPITFIASLFTRAPLDCTDENSGPPKARAFDIKMVPLERLRDLSATPPLMHTGGSN